MSEEGIVQAVFNRSMSDLMAINREITERFNRHQPASYDDFVRQIDTDLENIISNTESGKQYHFAKDEDPLTQHIIDQLKVLYPSVQHDPQNGGHCDIYMEAKSPQGIMFRWITEAKIWKGFDYVYGGLDEQLIRSYANGGIHNNQGGMLIYSKLASGGAYAMKKWHEGLEDKGLKIESLRSDKLRFTTRHQLNEGQGAEYTVRHYMIDVFHEPTKKVIEAEEAKKKAELKGTLRKEVEEELKEKLRKEVEEELKEKLRKEVEEELKEKLRKEVEEELKNKPS